MDRLMERCAGIDVHQQSMVVTVRVPAADGARTVRTQTFGTMTADLLVLREWLQAHAVTHVAMESTGVYWRPLYYLLEDGFTVLLINMQHLSHVPGRKSDVRDSEWLAQLLECGLLRGSLIPPAPIRDLRDLTRYPQAADRGSGAGSESAASRAAGRRPEADDGHDRCARGLGPRDG
jgi:transposase